ncbi:hypothetical protein [Sphaerotilus sp.]|uniref:hypothetical protein n=1 Tax=Sphaerotilus sp. TaxID=2093942 RepID=UPI002ACDC1E9|nr:hypothetical protein [Sphaerotilus sp.]MDZ7857930.1 hypothetical protein [Sphaerotilus sp.]
MKWDELTRQLGAAAAAVTAMFALFNSVLSDWVPPAEAMGAPAVTGIASFVSLVVLLVLVLVMRRRLTVAHRRQIAAAAGAAAIAGLVVAYVYYGDLDAHVFVWPPAASAQPDEGEPRRHLRGEFNEMGRQASDVSLTAAITEAGGLHKAQADQALWDETSRQQVERRLVLLYVVMTSLLSGAVFGLVLAVMFSSPASTA